MKKLLIIISILTAAGCGGGMHVKAGNGGNEADIDTSYATPWGSVTITKDAFIFGSDYPSDIVIPDIDGMRSTAFVVSFSAPTGVLAIDLDSNPLSISSEFDGLISPDGTGMPNSLLIMSANRAFLLTSSHVIDFNPTTGSVNTTLKLLDKLTLDRYRLISSAFDYNNDGRNEDAIRTIDMNFPGDLNVAGNKLYITMSNLLSPVTPAVAAPGVVRIFEIKERRPYLAESNKPIVTTDFNPTGITKLQDGLLAITNSGVSDIYEGAAHPITNSSIDFLDPESGRIIDNVSLGSVSLSFQEMAATSDGKTAYIGSSSFGEVYSIDLLNRSALHTHSNPITITGNSEGSDYISSLVLSFDDWYLFTASFDTSSIYPADAATTPPILLPAAFPDPFILGFPKGVTPENPSGTNTGIGDIAVRPGIPGVDYIGPDIFALTGNPGTMITINTHGTDTVDRFQIKEMNIRPGTLEISGLNGPAQLYLDIEFTNGTVIDNITGTLTNPYSGYPVHVRWLSSDPGVAEVNSGLVVPKTSGEAAITAQIGQLFAQAEITVLASAIPATSETPNETDPIEILTSAPPGTDPFADRVHEFSRGTNSGFGADKMPAIVLGPPKGKGNLAGGLDVVSLGSGGKIILEMTDFIIADGSGPDFIVFENVFYAGGNPNAPFSEPGIVSVSIDGGEFFEFDCDLNNSPHYPGCAGTRPTLSNPENGIDPTDPEAAGGNAFDLADLGLTTARFVKIVDGGRGGRGGPSAGFDLDAISVVNGILP